MDALRIVFWASVAMLVHTHLTYPLTLLALRRLAERRPAARTDGPPPSVSLIVPAHNEETVIGDRVRNARQTRYPDGLLEVIVTSDGSTDRTVERAGAAGADVVLDLSRLGKVEALNAAVEGARGEVLAFSDANAFWAPDALERLVAPLADPRVGYVCGQVRLRGQAGENQEGAYWRYEMAVRGLESDLGSVTAGNGAIYAVRRDAYVVMPSSRGHDLCFPYTMVRAGLRAVYEPGAVAQERMAPTLAGEFQRKRRMMNRTWGVLFADRVLWPRGYGALFAYQMLSHRGLRYASPLLHVVVLAANLALLGEGPVYALTLAAQLVLLAAAAGASIWPARPLRLARYYVVVTASIAVGLWDRLRSRNADTWTPVEGTR